MPHVHGDVTHMCRDLKKIYIYIITPAYLSFIVTSVMIQGLKTKKRQDFGSCIPHVYHRTSRVSEVCMNHDSY